MRITFYGVRGSCPCAGDDYRRYGGNTSCVLVEVDGEPPIILDLGTGLRALGTRLAAEARDGGRPLRATALLTHLHYDHVLGLPFFAPMRDPGAVLDVYGPAQSDLALDKTLGEIVQPPFFPIHMAEFRGELRFHDLRGPAELRLGDTLVRVRSVPHLGHTLGYRIEAGGRSVAYIPDHQAPVDRHEVDPGVLELCAGADLVVHDAQYTDEEFVQFPDWGHSTSAYALRVAEEAGAGQLALFHHDPSHGDRAVDAMLTAVRRLAGGRRGLRVTAAEEGTTVDLGERPGMTFDVQQFKRVMGQFATGVAIVAGLEDGHPVGFTCQSFMSLSLDPPYAAIAPARSSTSWPRIARAGAFCVNVLGEHQLDLCRAFAVSGGDKFAGVTWHGAPTTGAPVIDGSIAWVECDVELVHDAGDHELIMGRVLALGSGEGTPLLFFDAGFATLTPVAPDV